MTKDLINKQCDLCGIMVKPHEAHENFPDFCDCSLYYHEEGAVEEREIFYDGFKVMCWENIPFRAYVQKPGEIGYHVYFVIKK